MKNVAIFGTNSSSVTLKNLINNVYNPARERAGKEGFKVISLVSVDGKLNMSETNGYPVINFSQLKSFIDMKVIDAIILTREIFYGASMIVSGFIKAGIDTDNVYIAHRVDWEIVKDENVGSFIETYYDSKYLPYLEFHIADHCNLNCKACEHYSGLVRSPHFPDFDKFTKDMNRLHEFIDDIGIIRILGGEPLLNPEISKYIRLSRALYPKSALTVVTNGLVLETMPEEFFETLRQSSASITVSTYPPMHDKIEKLYRFLIAKRIPFRISPMKNEFTIKQTLNRHDHPREIFLDCLQAHCHNLYEGKIAACFLPFTTKYFNEYFSKNIPEDGAIDLYDRQLTTAGLKRRLLLPFERCRYCKSPVSVDWGQIKNPSVLSDWVAD